jgi:hypothetical protein
LQHSTATTATTANVTESTSTTATTTDYQILDFARLCDRDLAFALGENKRYPIAIVIRVLNWCDRVIVVVESQHLAPRCWRWCVTVVT